MDIKIKQARQEDLQDIYALVKELAAHVNSPHAVTATLDDYVKYFNDGIFEAILAEHKNEIIGMALYYTTFSTWKGKMIYLEDFVVKEVHRFKGVGQLLFDALNKLAIEKNAQILKWEVLASNTSAIKFYQKNKAIIETNLYSAKLFL